MKGSLFLFFARSSVVVGTPLAITKCRHNQCLRASPPRASSTTILSCCRGALLAHLDLPSLLTLRAVCRDLRAAVAREPLEDADTDVAHCLTQ